MKVVTQSPGPSGGSLIPEEIAMHISGTNKPDSHIIQVVQSQEMKCSTIAIGQLVGHLTVGCGSIPQTSSEHPPNDRSSPYWDVHLPLFWMVHADPQPFPSLESPSRNDRSWSLTNGSTQ